MANFRITDGKGFGFGFPNGWRVSVQFGYGNYADNYDDSEREAGEEFAARNIRLGSKGSNTAECACFDPAGAMVKLPKFMFDSEYTDVVSNRSTPEQVLKLLNWAAKKKAKAAA